MTPDEEYNGYPLTDEQCADLLKHLIRTLAVNGLSHLIGSIEESLVFIAPNSPDGEQRFAAEANGYPTTIFRRLLYYLDATIEYLQQTSSHHLSPILRQINSQLAEGELTDIVVEYTDTVDGTPEQISLSSLPNYSELVVDLQQIRRQIIIYRRNG
jgi:hypothetical protein